VWEPPESNEYTARATEFGLDLQTPLDQGSLEVIYVRPPLAVSTFTDFYKDRPSWPVEPHRKLDEVAFAA
jgi:hypothetical protein